MHFAIPDTQEINDGNGSTFIGYNIHINGIFHSTIRYKQLFNFNDQLKRVFGPDRLPTFPPKKLLPLTVGQVEERRVLLEKYIQTLGQDSKLIASDVVIGFFLSAQQETTCEKNKEVNLDIYAMNNLVITVRVSAFDRTEQVLSTVCKEINLPLEYLKYFSLYLIKKDKVSDVILRKLLDLESPYMSHKYLREPNRIYIRKSYWDSSYDSELMNDSVALNLLYVQTLLDLEHGWISCPGETKVQLATFQARLAKKEYIQLARTLKFYGFMQFAPCYCDYPKTESRVLVAIGDQQLTIRIINQGQVPKEGHFKVTRMRCWRVTAIHDKQNVPANSQANSTSLEMSFEYLMAKDKLQWISITSDQAILMSVCLQSLVDELLLKKKGQKISNHPIAKRGSWTYMKRDGSCHASSFENINGSTDSIESNEKLEESFSIKRLQEKFSSVSFKSGKEFVENHVFEGIGDDDL